MVLPSLTILGDYKTGDLAFLEIIQRMQVELPGFQLQTLSVPAFDTLGLGFVLAQLALNPGPEGRLFYHNCAPRRDNIKARLNNEGESLTFALLPNDVKAIGVFSGYTLSFLKQEAEALHYIDIQTGGSQFRSRDIFPQALGVIAKGDHSLVGREIDLNNIPDIPEDRIAWIDGYGNLKTTIEASTINLEVGTRLTVNLDGILTEAILTDGSFNVPEGTLAFAPGSSGWPTTAGHRRVWMELFLRGGSAHEMLSDPKTSKTISHLQMHSQTNPLLELHTT